MDILWSPWRSKYVEGFSKRNGKSNEHNACILCELPKKPDEESLIVERSRTCYVVLNIYPYNTGHVMVVPYRHVKSIDELNEEEIIDMMDLVRKMLLAIKRAYSPDGFNIGANIGRDAGAGIENHFHFHIVPRWRGDTNFMPVIGKTKVLPEDLETTFKKLKNALRNNEG